MNESMIYVIISLFVVIHALTTLASFVLVYFHPSTHLPYFISSSQVLFTVTLCTIKCMIAARHQCYTYMNGFVYSVCLVLFVLSSVWMIGDRDHTWRGKERWWVRGVYVGCMIYQFILHVCIVVCVVVVSYHRYIESKRQKYDRLIDSKNNEKGNSLLVYQTYGRRPADKPLKSSQEAADGEKAVLESVPYSEDVGGDNEENRVEMVGVEVKKARKRSIIVEGEMVERSAALVEAYNRKVYSKERIVRILANEDNKNTVMYDSFTADELTIVMKIISKDIPRVEEEKSVGRCGVCKERIYGRVDRTCVELPLCHHVFHVGCFVEYVLDDSTLCPYSMCRRNIRLDILSSIYNI